MPPNSDKAVRRYGNLEERFAALGGYAAESEAGRICASLGLAGAGSHPAVADTVRRTASASRAGANSVRRQRLRLRFGHHAAARRTNQPPRRRLDRLAARLPARRTPAGWSIISHNVDLLADVVNRVWFLDAVRGEADVYNMGWQKYLDARATDEQRRRRERANAEKKASALRTQAAKMGAKATKAVAAQNMLRRAERMMSALDDERVADKVAKIRFPTPGTVRPHAADRQGPDQKLRLAGGLHRGRPGHRPRIAGGRAGPQRRRQDHAAAPAGRSRDRRTPA